MSLHDFLIDPGSVRKALFAIAGASAAAALILKRVREKRSGEPRVIRLTLDTAGIPSAPAQQSPRQVEPTAPPQNVPAEILPPSLPIEAAVTTPAAEAIPEPVVQTAVATSEPPEPVPIEPASTIVPETFPVESPAEQEIEPAAAGSISYSFLTLQERNPILMDVLRGVAIMLAIAAFGTILLVTLPQPAIDRIAVALRPRNAPGPPPEKIAFLYLGDEVKDNQFHIRGVVRNISSQAIEQLETTVRIYAPDHTLLETQVVRMDTETIFPNATASFHLSFPDYRGQFGSYSLDFKLAQGDPVPYKDMREVRASS